MRGSASLVRASARGCVVAVWQIQFYHADLANAGVAGIPEHQARVGVCGERVRGSRVRIRTTIS